jgi:hypothetical protein
MTTETTMEIALKYGQRIAAGAGNDRLKRVWLHSNDEDKAVIYATDSYVAGRIETALDYDGDTVSVELPPKNLALQFGDFANLGDSEHAMPRIDKLFDKALEEGELFEYRRSVGGPDIRVSEWSYFDDERRRPGGVFKLTFEKVGNPPGTSDVMFTRGLKVGSHDKLTQGGAGFYWIDKIQVLGTVEGDRIDFLPTDKDGESAGVYHAGYLWPIEHAAWIGYTSPLKPLYTATPNRKAEFLTMGIRL